MQAACAAKANNRFFDLLDPINVDIYNALPESNKYREIMDRHSNGMFSKTIYFRKRYFYESLVKDSENYSQLIVLSCGLDFGSLSIGEWKGRNKFFIDHPASLQLSFPILKKVCNIPYNIKFLPINLELNGSHKYLIENLLKNDFDTKKNTLVIWEGSTYFLERKTILKIIFSLSKFVKNLKIIFDYVVDLDNHLNVSEFKKMEIKDLNKINNFIRNNNEPWKTKFKIADLEENLKVMSFNKILTETDIEVQKKIYGFSLEDYKLMFAFTNASKF